MFRIIFAFALVGCVSSSEATQGAPDVAYCLATNAAEIQPCIDAVSTGSVGGTVELAPGNYYVTTTLSVYWPYTRVVGAGRGGTQLVWQGTGELFNVTADQVTIDSMLLYTSQSGATAIKAIDVTGLLLRDTTILGMGLELYGRDSNIVEKVFVQADQPVQLSNVDHYVFRDTYFIELGLNHPIIAVDGTSVCNDLIFEGQQVWVGGSYGFYWGYGTAAGSSTRIVFRGIRREQASGAGATIYIDRPNPSRLWHLIIENAGFAYQSDGVFTRGVFYPAVVSSTYDGAPGRIFLDNDHPVYQRSNLVIER